MHPVDPGAHGRDAGPTVTGMLAASERGVDNRSLSLRLPRAWTKIRETTPKEVRVDASSTPVGNPER